MIQQSTKAYRVRLAAICFVVSGILFVLYPAIRPFSDESSMAGAQAFASFSWVLAHSLAMVAFVLLTLGLLGLYLLLQHTTVEHRAIQALVLSLIGVGLTLPYYGAEAFGLHAIGQEALGENNAALLSLANSVRFEQGILFFIPGLLLLAISTLLSAIAVWRSGAISMKWSGVPLAVGFALYIPQFAAPQPIRVAHGILIMAACVLLAWSMSKGNKPISQPTK